MKTYRSNKGLKKRCSCARRSWETCNHPWFFTFQFKGRVERGSLGQSEREKAVAKFTEIKAGVMNGTYVKAKPQAIAPIVEERPTFAMVAGYYLKQHVQPKLSAGAAAHHRSILA